jgi:hypothetical protein
MTLSKRPLLLGALLLAASGCGDDPAPPAPGPSEPTLSQEPIWSLEQSTQNGASCFGNSFAFADINGDGRKDLVAALPSCNWATTQGMGKVGLYAGTDSFFSPDAVLGDMTWQNTNSRTSGRGMSVSAGNVNGDSYADLLVRGFYGVQVFTGKADLGTVLAAPAFRVPGNGTFGGAHFSDLNGDGLDDLVSIKGGSASLYLATPQGSGGPFTLARTLPAIATRQVGDTNDDGAEDLLVELDNESSLYLGCKPGSSLACEGPVTAQPVWTIARTVRTVFPDQNGDGRAEVFVGDYTSGRTWLHLSDAATGGLSTVPAWSVMGDPLFHGFAYDIQPVGDLDGDGKKTEFVVTAAGRLYLYTPEQGLSAELRPSWAWPEADSFEGQHQLTGLELLPAGDLTGDGRDDLILGIPPSWESSKPGRVMVLSGGKVPDQNPAPFLPEKRDCVAGTSGKPDITVDGDVLGRSLYVERKTFSDTSCEVLEGCVGGTGERRLLRFSVSIPNFGKGPMVIPGPTTDPSLYQYDSCHAHDHLIEFANYELKDEKNVVTATGRKQGFYLIDFNPYCMDAAPPADFGLDLGISPGWADIYTSDLPCQWLDITNVPDGVYSLRVAVDTRNIIDEEDMLPNFADVKLRLQGDSVKREP